MQQRFSSFVTIARRFRRLLQVALALAVFLLMALHIQRNWEELSGYGWKFNRPLLVLSFVLLCGYQFLAATMWHLAMVRLGERLKLVQSVKIWFLQ